MTSQHSPRAHIKSAPEGLRALYLLIASSILSGAVVVAAGTAVADDQDAQSMPEIVSEPVEPESIPRDERLRQIPGEDARAVQFPQYIYESLPDINTSASEFAPVYDRWRQLYQGKFYDPYNQNVMKADIPVFGDPAHPWFFELGVISDTLYEHRNLPVPVGGPSTAHPESTDTFGDFDQNALIQTFIFSFSLFQGNTSFKPQDIEFRLVPALSVNYVDLEEQGATRVDPTKGSDRTDNHIGFNEAFVDIHISNLSDRYDFVSTRIGIQKFLSDFRGFVFSDEAPGVRFFGNYDNNIYQYNLAWFNRLDKDTNSGINTFDNRYEQVFVANVFRQDTLAPGHTTELSVIHRIDNAGNHADDYDNNGFLVRPAAFGDERSKNLQTTYIGLTGDGHFGRINTTEAFYYVTGSESHNQIAGQHVDISAAMAALEASYDQDFIRYRGSFFWASGDDDPFDGRAGGFDAINDLPNFAGGDLSFWQRNGIPFIGGGGVNLTNRNSLLPDLRAGKEEGQSNFVNPGIFLYNLGLDVEVLPELKLINNISYMRFADVDSIKALRQDGSISHGIGWDLSTGILYRPFLNNNVQFRAGASILFPDDGVENLFGDDKLYNIFGNVILVY